MKAAYQVKALLQFDISEDGKKARILAVDFALDAPPSLIKYLQHDDGKLTLAGHVASTDTLTHALIANIHAAHQAGLIKSHEHLKKIIDMLEKGFADPTAQVSTGIYGETLLS